MELGTHLFKTFKDHLPLPSVTIPTSPVASLQSMKNYFTRESVTEATSSVYDRVQYLIEMGAATKIGQITLKKIDNGFWVIEKIARWSLPVKENKKDPDSSSKNTELVRPLPWIPFLMIIILLRILRATLSFLAILIDRPSVTPTTMVSFIQKNRRKIRIVKLNGLRQITNNKEEVTSGIYGKLSIAWKFLSGTLQKQHTAKNSQSTEEEQSLIMNMINKYAEDGSDAEDSDYTLGETNSENAEDSETEDTTKMKNAARKSSIDIKENNQQKHDQTPAVNWDQQLKDDIKNIEPERVKTDNDPEKVVANQNSMAPQKVTGNSPSNTVLNGNIGDEFEKKFFDIISNSGCLKSSLNKKDNHPTLNLTYASSSEDFYYSAIGSPMENYSDNCENNSYIIQNAEAIQPQTNEITSDNSKVRGKGGPNRNNKHLHNNRRLRGTKRYK